MVENTLALDLAVGRSSVRQRILALLMDETAGRLHLREIQRRVGTSPGTASRELAKLVAAGLIDREAEGNQVYFRASSSPLATMLRTVLVSMPAPQVKPRPPRLPRAASGPAAAPADTPLGDATPVPPLAPAGLPASAVAADTVPPPAEPAPAEAPSETTPVEEPRPASFAPRVIRPAPAAPVAKADPLGLRIAGRLAESIREIYGDSLRGFYLYGSRASGPAPAEADVETIVVLEKVDHYGAELERTSHVCAALSHEMNLVVSRIFVSEADWNGDPDGVTPAIRAEAVAL
ncbi:MAG: winged helix-turn-helix domain-containing protein [Candidatus Limnocylindrales bacterium]